MKEKRQIKKAKKKRKKKEKKNRRKKKRKGKRKRKEKKKKLGRTRPINTPSANGDGPSTVRDGPSTHQRTERTGHAQGPTGQRQVTLEARTVRRSTDTSVYKPVELHINWRGGTKIHCLDPLVATLPAVRKDNRRH